jgi:hypothetical protein
MERKQPVIPMGCGMQKRRNYAVQQLIKQQYNIVKYIADRYFHEKQSRQINSDYNKTDQ